MAKKMAKKEIAKLKKIQKRLIILLICIVILYFPTLLFSSMVVLTGGFDRGFPGWIGFVVAGGVSLLFVVDIISIFYINRRINKQEPSHSKKKKQRPYTDPYL